jgi:hypothetical protein
MHEEAEMNVVLPMVAGQDMERSEKKRLGLL